VNVHNLKLRWNHPRLLGLVAIGGAGGSLLRFAVGLAFAPESSYLGTLTVNVVGSLVLGFLLETVSLRGPETARLQQIRLLIGTGICGGFTTYSTFALDLQQRIAVALETQSVHSVWVLLGYLLGTLGFGTLATIFGIWLAARLARRSGFGAVSSTTASCGGSTTDSGGPRLW